MKSISYAWRHRNWQADQTALEQLGNTKPAMVITGGSEGIGLELARKFARNRSSIVLVARSRERLDKACRSLSAESAEIIPLTLDITSADAASTIRAELATRGLHVEELVNNAGIGLSSQYSDMPPADIDRLINLNVTALSRLTREFLPDMRVRGSGGVINMASLGGLTPGPYQAAYYASKAYVVSLTRAIAYENRGMGLSITCVAPGPVSTEFHARMDAEQAFYRRFLPALTAADVAKSTVFWYGTGRALIVPGVFNSLLALAVGFLPGALTIPVVAFLLNPREPERDV